MFLTRLGCAYIVAYVSCVCAIPFVAALDIPKFSRIVVFGDSLVDNGNGTYTLSNHTWPSDPAYFDGRFSNGMTWPEQLASMLNITHVNDYAYGSATTDNRIAAGYSGYNSTLPVPDVRGQVSMYLKHVEDRADPDALYVVSGGSNDIFFGVSSTRNVTQLACDAVAALQRDAARLRRHGARTILVPTLSEMQVSPWATHYADSSTRTSTKHFTRLVNEQLRSWARNQHGGKHPIKLFDVYNLEADILKNPSRYQLRNTHDACLVGTQKLERVKGLLLLGSLSPY
ncbi:hypothetical protein MPSI1_001605 [Malassezia psittaci]|uniref:Uncharacterized protein n=1 Tax=Malassezia psittaci TaxID=1821823 RepID=A0AAF0F9S6_9BASI|nr:hypothetical protein MPSI1_001605 [Malassezia psittaci]